MDIVQPGSVTPDPSLQGAFLQMTWLFNIFGQVLEGLRLSQCAYEVSKCSFLIRQWSKAALTWWLRTVARPLNIEHYLLPPRPPQQPVQRPLPALAAPADPVAASHQSSTAEAPEHMGPASHEAPSLAQEASPGQPAAPFTDSSPVLGSQEVRQPAARHAHVHDQQSATGSEGSDLIPGLSSVTHAPQQAHPDSGSSERPQASRSSAASYADLTHESGEGSQPPKSAREAGNEPGDTHTSLFWRGGLLEGEDGGVDSQQAAQSSVASSHKKNESDGPSSSWVEHQAAIRPQYLSQSYAQPGPSTENDGQAEAANKRVLHQLPDGLSRASAAGVQSGVASGVGQLPSPGAQAAPVPGSHEAFATAEGLVANMQLVDSDELTSQLLIVAVLLMLTLLLFVTGLLTLPCIIGKQSSAILFTISPAGKTGASLHMTGLLPNLGLRDQHVRLAEQTRSCCICVSKLH